MRFRILLVIALVSLNYPPLFIDATSTCLINRRVRTPQLFITAKELFAECDRNSRPRFSFSDPAKQLPHGEWYYGQVGIGEIRELKGVKFDPPLDVVAKSKGGDKEHLLCALLNEYWLATGEVQARNVPYILTVFPFFQRVDSGYEAYFYEYREGRETSPPTGVYTRNPWTLEAEEKRPMPPFLAKLLELGLLWNRDVVQSDDGRVGKHWIEGPNYNDQTHEDGWLIDYGSISISGEFKENFSLYLKEQETQMREILGYKYDLLKVTFQLMTLPLSYKINPTEEKRIEREYWENQFYRLFSRYQQEIWGKILAERGITPP